MPGIRIHHPSLRSCTLVVPHPGDGARRGVKDYHIRLDADGNCIVSETVWKRLREARGDLSDGVSKQFRSMHDFIVLNEVADPPALVIGQVYSGNSPQTFRQEYDVVKEMAPPGIKPRILER